MARRTEPPMTKESIDASHAQMLRDRVDVLKETGVVIRHDGTIILPPHVVAKLRPKHWYCEMCDRWFAKRHLDCPRCGCRLLRAH